MLIPWITGELISYHPFTWCMIVAIAFFASRQWKLLGTLAGHALISIIIASLDMQWIESEMQKPGWDPNDGPDMDIGFMIAGVLRIIAVNTVLLPISILGLYAGSRKASEPTQVAAASENNDAQ